MKQPGPPTKKPGAVAGFVDAEGGTRTHMGVSPLRPERSASANFATSASKECIVAEPARKSRFRTAPANKMREKTGTLICLQALLRSGG